MLHIIYKNNKPVGWEMRPVTPEEQEIVAIIRNLQYFGLEDGVIRYNDLELIKPSLGKKSNNIKRISWLKQKHLK